MSVTVTPPVAVVCDNLAHDHVSPEANTCVDCGRATHYDTGCEGYVHDDLDAECWLIASISDVDRLGIFVGATPCFCNCTSKAVA